MSKKIVFVLVLLAAVIPVQANSLWNDGFEQPTALDGWWTYLATPAAQSIGIATSPAIGTQSVAIYTTDGTTAKIGQNITISPSDVGKAISVGVSYDNSAGAWNGGGISINYYDASWAYLNYAWVSMFSASGGDDTGWVAFNASTGEGTWTIPANTAYIGYEIHQWGWEASPSHYDNAVLTIVPEPATMIMLSIGGLALIRRKVA
jgi:hypothetical protein